MLTRRRFLQLSTATSSALWFAWQGSTLSLFGAGVPTRVLAQVATATLDPAQIPKYQAPVVVPPVMPRKGVLAKKNGQRIDYYEIALRQFSQQILPPGFPATTVWGYGALKAPGTVAEGGSFYAPSFTIEARSDRPVRVKWINDLVDADGHYLPHLLTVDPTLHWANPPGGKHHRDSRPTFLTTPDPYRGPVPMVVHVHGAPGVGDESDGYAEAWYLPAAKNIPDGYAHEGSWYTTFKREFKKERRVGHHSDTWTRGTATYQYPNADRASTLWYHDHTLGMTRLNVYAGPAGFYLLRGGAHDVVYDSRTGAKATLPGPAPARGDHAGKRYYELPLAIQDRSFQTDGSLFYPDSRAFFDGLTGPYIPETDISPNWNPEFFGNVMLVNGVAWPFHAVEQRRYRLRLLNGCNARFLLLQFADPRVEVWQIGNEGGFLAAPVRLNDHPADGDKDGTAKVLLAPSERADLLVDFTALPAGATVLLRNLAPDEPFGGFPIEFPADPETTGQVMAFQVIPIEGRDRSTPPAALVLPSFQPLVGQRTRTLALMEEMSMFADGPVEAQLGLVVEGHGMMQEWMAPITENPEVGAVEVWELYNFTADAHPIHLHETRFQVVNRQPLALDANGEVRQPVELSGPPRSAEVWESGFKDVVIAYPGEVTRICADFDTPGLFVWHCHIVEHEDNEMMRPYFVGPMNLVQAAADGADDEVEEPIAEEEQAVLIEDDTESLDEETTTNLFVPLVMQP